MLFNLVLPYALVSLIFFMVLRFKPRASHMLGNALLLSNSLCPLSAYVPSVLTSEGEFCLGLGRPAPFTCAVTYVAFASDLLPKAWLLEAARHYSSYLPCHPSPLRLSTKSAVPLNRGQKKSGKEYTVILINDVDESVPFLEKHVPRNMN